MKAARMSEPNLIVPELSLQCLGHIFGHLSSHDAARVACAHKSWHALVVSDEQLWRRHLTEELGITDKQGADGQAKVTYWEAYASYRQAFSPEYWPYLGRALAAWRKIKTWLAANIPEILATLQAGLSEAEVARVEAELGFALPPALKVLYRLHDGQALASDANLERRVRQRLGALAGGGGGAAAARGGTGAGGSGSGPAAAADATEPRDDEDTDSIAASIFHGLFGGYVVYDHRVVSRMLPLRRAALWRAELLRSAAETTQRVHAQLERQHGRETAVLRWQHECAWREAQSQRMGLQRRANLDNMLPLACSYDLYDKVFMADAAGGGLAVAKLIPGGWDLREAVPRAETNDGPLRWLEEYARRLEGGWYEATALDDQYPKLSRGISLFPLAPPGLVEAVTRGVRVRASVVYVPEANVSAQGRHLFAYSIRFSLMDGAPLRRCQLTHRHWVIRDEAGEETDQVRGEGVIGKYPLLEPGQPEFVYCSCTHQLGPRGSMEGEFQFVPGTRQHPEGPAFDVVCPTFRLDLPEYIY